MDTVINAEKISQFDAMIGGAERVVIIGHYNPDGDCVGSVSALSSYLDGRSVGNVVVLPGPYPQFLSFLDSGHRIKAFSIKDASTGGQTVSADAEQAVKDADLMICLDHNTPGRTEGMEPLLREAPCSKVLIDHHPNPESSFYDLVFSDTEMSSASELLFWILMEMPDISSDIRRMELPTALSLCAGMLSDTNNFNNSVTPSTFRMSSLLMDRGVDFTLLNDLIFGRCSQDRMKLMGYMLSNMTIDPETASACMILTRKIQRKYNFVSGDSEGFVNLGLKIKGVEVSALFTEEADRVRVSLRSKGGIRVNRLSETFFHGGGHDKASGGKLTIPVTEVRDYYLSALRQFICDEGITFADASRPSGQ